MTRTKPEPKAPRPFTFAGYRIEPGSQCRVDIPVAPLYTQAMVYISTAVYHGVAPGPRLWLSACVHGDELNGLEIVRRIMSDVDPSALAGTLVVVPCVNLFGLLHQSRYLPDRRDLNRSFPGSRRGSLASRLAHLFMKEVVEHCTHGIDLHTAGVHRFNLPQIRANLDDPATRRMARAFGAPVTVQANERDGSLRQSASKLGVPTLLYEAGEALHLDPESIETGVLGIRRVMAHLGMTDTKPKRGTASLVARRTKWVRAANSGWLSLSVRAGDCVWKGERIGIVHTGVHRQLGLGSADHPIEAPFDAMVIGHLVNPLVHVGDAVVNLAELSRAKKKKPTTRVRTVRNRMDVDEDLE